MFDQKKLSAAFDKRVPKGTVLAIEDHAVGGHAAAMVTLSTGATKTPRVFTEADLASPKLSDTVGRMLSGHAAKEAF